MRAHRPLRHHLTMSRCAGRGEGWGCGGSGDASSCQFGARASAAVAAAVLANAGFGVRGRARPGAQNTPVCRRGWRASCWTAPSGRSVATPWDSPSSWFGFGGPSDMLAAARAATGLETDGRSAQFAIAQAALGRAHYVQGKLEQAVPPLRAASRAEGAPGMIRIVALSLECFAESERGNTMHARECADRAIEVLDSRGLGASPQVSWAYVALALAQADAGKSDDAMRTLELGLSTREQGSTQAVWGPIHHLLVSARIAARLGHTALARELLADVTERMSRFFDGMSTMLARVDEVRRLIKDHDAVDVVGEPLTERELDVLRLMQSSLSLQEIAVELYLSANTVKTHARAVYRKLGAHSRTDAVALARRRSLI
ncbi:LuxR C-terminal-related transcriptional regulator [uncultured Nocardioides sp.]|uniref:LuxR C-terminal-related transcriptional regulator n=1 Tax=uncultured Nocardioides sp. TaxID=198441 RepID=UPI003456493A